MRHPHRALRATLAIALLVLGSGCLKPVPSRDFARPLPAGTHALERAEPHEYPDFRQIFVNGQNDGSIIEAIDESLAYLAKPSSREHFPYRASDRSVTHDDQVQGLQRLREIFLESTDARQFAIAVFDHFEIYHSVGWDGHSGEMLFTAYYTPIFEGSLTPTAEFRYPLYRRPADLVIGEDGTPRGQRTADGGVAPYPTRAEIEASSLLAGTELVYLKDPFDAYIVHVQGSAIIDLPDGRRMRVGYAGKTDRPYGSVAEALVKRGRMSDDEISLFRLRQHFRDHPEDLSLLSVNESYVFFTETAGGPYGSIGARVTPLHTIATDKSVFPRGGPVVAVTRLPVVDPATGQRRLHPHTGFYLDQDTGGAIRSAGRADLYLGVGAEAERVAGYTRSVGRLYYLFPKRTGTQEVSARR